MSQWSLGDLQKKALPALRHVELVTLAKDENLTPQGVKEAAKNLDWPTRQAVAARYLAIIRRDHGQKVLDTFVTTMELARQQRTEHAQEVPVNALTISPEDILRHLDHADPPLRLKLLIEHGLTEKFFKELADLLEQDQPYFQDFSRTNRGGKTQLFYKPPIKKAEEEVDEDQENKEKEKPFPVLCFVNTAVEINIDGMFDHFEDQLADPDSGPSMSRRIDGIVDTALQGMMRMEPGSLRTSIASWAGPWETHALARVIQRFMVDSADELSVQINIWLLRAWFFDDVTLVQNFAGSHKTDRDQQVTWLGKKVPQKDCGHHDSRRREISIENMTAVVDAFGDRMLELGVSKEDLRADLYAWLHKYEDGGLNPDYSVAVAKSRHFDYEDQVRAETMFKRLPNVIEGLFDGGTWLRGSVIVHGLLDCGATRREGRGHPGRRLLDVEKLYFKHMGRILGKGHVARAYEIRMMFGKQLTTVRGDAPPLHQSVAEGFHHAVTAGQFGTAAALQQLFGAEKCYNEIILLEVVQEQHKEERAAADALKLKRDQKSAHKAIGDKEEIALEELKVERRRQIVECVQIALTLGQPIALDYTTSFTNAD